MDTFEAYIEASKFSCSFWQDHDLPPNLDGVLTAFLVVHAYARDVATPIAYNNWSWATERIIRTMERAEELTEQVIDSFDLMSSESTTCCVESVTELTDEEEAVSHERLDETEDER